MTTVAGTGYDREAQGDGTEERDQAHHDSGSTWNSCVSSAWYIMDENSGGAVRDVEDLGRPIGMQAKKTVLLILQDATGNAFASPFQL